MVEPAPEGDEREMLLSVVKPEKPVPAAVGARDEGGDEEKGVDDGGALDKPAVEPPPSET
jgi:hypothetical protein